jgi:predicted nucleotidyltransferase component of viral defense system
VTLPALPDPALLSDLSRETAAREGVQPELVEKDFYLTRLLSAFGERFGRDLLLKGGTLLSKVDIGFFRMSEDADLVLPGTPSRYKRTNAKRLHAVRDAIRALGPTIGVTARLPGGELFERGAHALWELEYRSEFGRQRIKVEVAIRPVLAEPRQVRLRQLMNDRLLGDYTAASCWALDASEARAEKVRAAFTRDAIRDFYDLQRLADVGADFTSREFVALVDEKLAELKEPPLHQQPPSFGLDERRRRNLETGVRRELPAVLRAGAPQFDLGKTLARFDRLWRRLR